MTGRGPRRPTGFVAALLMAAIALTTLAVGGGGTVYHMLTRPGPATTDIGVVIPNGTSINGIAEILKRQGILAESETFRFGVRFLASAKPLQAGEFNFPPAISAIEAIRILQDGVPVAHRLTIPEGLTNTQIHALLSQQQELGGAIMLPTDEGRLLPETYHFTRGDTVGTVIERMRLAMDETISELWPGRDSDLPFATPDEAITLASIVEKETGLPHERPLVAAVFINRLRIGMRLQADPTIAFVVGGGTKLDRPLTLRDLRIESPYNSYKYAGLPPGPIANPGRASIEAVLHPADSPALYFVADGTGGHAFANNLAGHNENVARYRTRAD